MFFFFFVFLDQQINTGTKTFINYRNVTITAKKKTNVWTFCNTYKLWFAFSFIVTWRAVMRGALLLLGFTVASCCRLKPLTIAIHAVNLWLPHRLIANDGKVCLATYKCYWKTSKVNDDTRELVLINGTIYNASWIGLTATAGKRICFSKSVMYIRIVVTLVFTTTFQAEARRLASLLRLSFTGGFM